MLQTNILKTMSISMHNIRQHQGETLMNWADKAYQTCVRDNPLASEAKLERLANWIFTEGLLDGEITKLLRRRQQIQVGLVVTVGKALDLRLNIPATNDDNDDDRWSTTATVAARATGEMATQTEMEKVPLNLEYFTSIFWICFFLGSKRCGGQQSI